MRFVNSSLIRKQYLYVAMVDIDAILTIEKIMQAKGEITLLLFQACVKSCSKTWFI